ncbi:MAG: SCO family protein [Acidobacteriaceae bacterium]|nr:SCO family protein [Acidobacteriaceae bacterium]
MRSRLFVSVWMAIAGAGLLGAQYARPALTKGVTIEQKLNSQLPLDAVFHDETNQPVALWKYFGDKPVVLSLVYFTCPSLCPMSLHETVQSLKRISLKAGRDYNVVVVSFNPKDTAQQATEAKAKYRAESGNAPGFNEGWHFLTGDETSIKRLTDAVGFRYRWDAKAQQFVHAGGITVATPDGKMSKYFYGIDYAPADVRMALVEASQHKIGSAVDYMLLFCFHYDATQGRYTLAIVNILKIAAGITVFMLAGLLYLLMRNDKPKDKRTAWKEVRHVS